MANPSRPATRSDRAASTRKPQTVPLEDAGQWIAWSADGLRIVAVGPTRRACPAAVPPDHVGQVVFDRVPPRGRRTTGPES